MFLSVMKLCNFRNRNAYLSGSIRWTNADVGTNAGAGGMNPVEIQVLELYCFCVPVILLQACTGTAFQVEKRYRNWVVDRSSTISSLILIDFELIIFYDIGFSIWWRHIGRDRDICFSRQDRDIFFLRRDPRHLFSRRDRDISFLRRDQDICFLRYPRKSGYDNTLGYYRIL